MNTQKETCTTLRARIKAVRDLLELQARAKRITRHYNNGTINARHPTRLDTSIMERMDTT